MRLAALMFAAAGMLGSQQQHTTTEVFVQGPVVVKISSVPAFEDGIVTGFNQTICARSYDAGISQFAIVGRITLVDSTVVTFDQPFLSKRNVTYWRYPACQIVATTEVPALQVTFLSVTPLRADAVIVFVPSLPTPAPSSSMPTSDSQ